MAHHLKTALLLNLLENTNARSVLVFTRTKHRVKSLNKKLMTAGYQAASLQGNLSQSRRQASLDGFRDGKYKILVATDIATRSGEAYTFITKDYGINNNWHPNDIMSM